jgi:hypothetical protein
MPGSLPSAWASPPTVGESGWPPWSRAMRAVQITRFGGPEALDIVDIPEPVAGPRPKLYEVSPAGVNFADTHQQLSRN